MVKVLHLGLVAILCAVVAVSFARPLHRQQSQQNHPVNYSSGRGGTAEATAADMGTAPLPSSSTSVDEIEDDGSVRSERSPNPHLSSITGTKRKIEMVMKYGRLQILPDGTVNGTEDGDSDYTILQRTSTGLGHVKIQGVATCLFLCMDHCGLLYGSKEYTEDCIFNETIEQHNFNTYSSRRHSNGRKTFYLALNKRGQPRRVQIRNNSPLGKMTSYTHVLPQTVSASRVERFLKARELSAAPDHATRHGSNHLCPPTHLKKDQEQDEAGRDKARCRGRRKRGKKKRKCRKGEEESDQCRKQNNNKNVEDSKTGESTKRLREKKKHRKKCNEGEDKIDCKRRLQAERRKWKSRNGDNKGRDNSEDSIKKKQRKPKMNKKKRKFVSDGEISKDLDSGRLRNKVKKSRKNKQQNQRDLEKDSEILGVNVTMTGVQTSSTTASSELTSSSTSEPTTQEGSSFVPTTVPSPAASFLSSSASPTSK